MGKGGFGTGADCDSFRFVRIDGGGFRGLDRDGHTDFFVAEILSRTPINRLLKIGPNTPTLSPVLVGTIAGSA